MVNDATKKYREPIAYALLAVAGLWFIGGLSLLFKNADIGFATRSALVGGVFEAPIAVVSLVVATILVTRFGEPSPNARIVVLAALGIAGLNLLFGVITFLAQFGSDVGGGFLGIGLAGKAVGTIMGLAELVFLAAAAFYLVTALQGLPAPQGASSRQRGPAAGYATYGPGGQQAPGGQQGGWAPPPAEQGYPQGGQQGWAQPAQPYGWGSTDQAAATGWSGQPAQPGQAGQPGQYDPSAQGWQQPPAPGGGWEQPPATGWNQPAYGGSPLQQPGQWNQEPAPPAAAAPAWGQPAAPYDEPATSYVETPPERGWGQSDASWDRPETPADRPETSWSQSEPTAEPAGEDLFASTPGLDDQPDPAPGGDEGRPSEPTSDTPEADEAGSTESDSGWWQHPQR